MNLKPSAFLLLYFAIALRALVADELFNPFGPRFEKDLECKISVATRSAIIGSNFVATLTLQNVGTNELHIPMPVEEATKGSLTVYLAVRDGTKFVSRQAVPIRVPSYYEAINKGVSRWLALQPKQTKDFEVNITLPKESIDKDYPLALGHYGLVVDFHNGFCTTLTDVVTTRSRGSRVVESTPEADRLDKESKLFVLDLDKEWMGTATSNFEPLILVLPPQTTGSESKPEPLPQN